MNIQRYVRKNFVFLLIFFVFLISAFFFFTEGFQSNQKITLPNAPLTGTPCRLTFNRQRQASGVYSNCPSGYTIMSSDVSKCVKNAIYRCPSNTLEYSNKKCMQRCTTLGNDYTVTNFQVCKHKVNGDFKYVNQVEPVCV